MGRFQTRQEIRCTHHSWVAASPVGIAAATEPEVHSYPDIGRTEQRPATSPPGTKSFDQHAPSWRRNGATTPHRLSASPTQAWPSPGAGGVDVAPLHAPRPPPRMGTEMYSGPRRASADGRGEDQPLRRFLPAAPRGLDVPQQLQLRGRLRATTQHRTLREAPGGGGSEAQLRCSGAMRPSRAAPSSCTLPCPIPHRGGGSSRWGVGRCQ